MGKLFFRLFLFLLPVGVILVLLPVQTRMKFLALKDDCFNHGIWVHDRFAKNDKPVDIAFLGSSHTVNGIDDRLIEQLLDTLKTGLYVANFGYCRLGKNFNFSLLSSILKKKKTRFVVLEVREDEDRYSHPIFPFIASTKEVLLAYPFFNPHLFSDIGKHLSYKLELCKDQWFQKTGEVPFVSDDYGFSAFADTASPEKLNAIKLRKAKPKASLSNFERDFYMAFPREYLARIARLCRDNDVSLVFLYMPSFAGRKLPLEHETYLNYGPVLIPPDSILENTALWFDGEHLNIAGAQAISTWVALAFSDLRD